MPDFASNTNFIAPVVAPYLGVATKVAMTAAQRANGFVPGKPIAAEHLNSELNLINAGSGVNAAAIAANGVSIAANGVSIAALNQWNLRAATVRCIPRYTGLTTADTSGVLAVASRLRSPRGDAHADIFNRGAVVAFVDAAGVAAVSDHGAAPMAGAGIISITSQVRGLAFNPNGAGHFVAVGTGGNQSCYTASGEPISFIAGGALGGAGRYVLWNPTYSRFMALYADHARYSADATAWTDVTVTGVAASTMQGMARLANGNVVTPSSVTGPVLKISTNGGTSWATTTGVPSGSPYIGIISVTGEGFDTVWFAAVRASDSAVLVAKSTDGQAWSTVTTLGTAFWGMLSGMTQATIKQCPDTGILFLCASPGAGSVHQASVAFSASLDQGVTWSAPAYFGFGKTGNICNSAAGWGVAGGRIICVDDSGRLYASDGFGADTFYAT